MSAIRPPAFPPSSEPPPPGPPEAEPVSPEEDQEQRIVDELAGPGWSICRDFLSPEETRTLFAECRELWEEGAFRRARVGIGRSLELRPEVRSDYVLWLGEEPPTPAQERYLARLEGLRLALNQALYLGLFTFEGHLTVYPPGASYRRHLDQFKGAAHRMVTAILYLNPGWDEADGGHLRLYVPGGEGEEEAVDVPPLGGTLVSFLSALFEHEVLPARRERWSLTGWFRLRG